MTITYRLDESVAAKIDRHMAAGGYKYCQTEAISFHNTGSYPVAGSDYDPGRV
jgi:hypothetical protein